MTDEVTIPAGMKAWAGGDSAPADWSDGPVMLRNGSILSREPDIADWRDDGLWNDIIAYTPMTPEPAQPAESPEARALREAQDKRREALIERLGTVADLTCQTPLPGDLGDVAYDLLRQAAAQISSDRLHIRRLLAATTARPTEREPVAWCTPGQLANLTDVDRDGGVYLPIRKTERGNFTMPLYAARPTERGMVERDPAIACLASLRAAISLLEKGGKKAAASDKMFAQMLVDYHRAADDFAAALTPPVTVAATDSRITKDWCLNMARLEDGQEIGAGMPDHPLRAPEVAATDQAGEVDLASIKMLICEATEPRERHPLLQQAIDMLDAALDTQRATGRTMGGEDEQAVADLHALQHDGTTLAAKPTWGGSIIRWAADEIRGLRAALQNGDE